MRRAPNAGAASTVAGSKTCLIINVSNIGRVDEYMRQLRHMLLCQGHLCDGRLPGSASVSPARSVQPTPGRAAGTAALPGGLGRRLGSKRGAALSDQPRLLVLGVGAEHGLAVLGDGLAA